MALTLNDRVLIEMLRALREQKARELASLGAVADLRRQKEQDVDTIDRWIVEAELRVRDIDAVNDARIFALLRDLERAADRESILVDSNRDLVAQNDHFKAWLAALVASEDAEESPMFVLSEIRRRVLGTEVLSKTHYEGCYRAHHQCAIALADARGRELDRLRSLSGLRPGGEV